VIIIQNSESHRGLKKNYLARRTRTGGYRAAFKSSNYLATWQPNYAV